MTDPKTLQHVVPAYPGFTVLEPLADSTGAWVEFCRHPVIAWRISHAYVPDLRAHVHMTIPLTIDHAEPDAPIEYPDGRIVLPEGATFHAEADALAYLNEHRDR